MRLISDPMPKRGRGSCAGLGAGAAGRWPAIGAAGRWGCMAPFLLTAACRRAIASGVGVPATGRCAACFCGAMKADGMDYARFRNNLKDQILVERLRERQLDFALIALPYDTPDLRVLPLYKDRFWLVVREDDHTLAGRTLRLSSDWTERLLLLEEGHCLREHALQACQATEVASAEGIEATSLLTLVQMVASGMGVALVPEMAIDSGLIAQQPLKAKPLAAPAPERVIALVTRTTSPHMAEFEAIARVITAATGHKPLTPARQSKAR